MIPAVAAELFAVNFEVCHGTPYLTSPAISAQHLLSKILVILLLERERRLFGQDLKICVAGRYEDDL